MAKILAKCPECRTEKEVKRMLGSESVEGDCDDCKIHFTTATWWQEKRRLQLNLELSHLSLKKLLENNSLSTYICEVHDMQLKKERYPRLD